MTPAQWARVLHAAWLATRTEEFERIIQAMRDECKAIAKETE